LLAEVGVLAAAASATYLNRQAQWDYGGGEPGGFLVERRNMLEWRSLHGMLAARLPSDSQRPIMTACRADFPRSKPEASEISEVYSVLKFGGLVRYSAGKDVYDMSRPGRRPLGEPSCSGPRGCGATGVEQWKIQSVNARARTAYRHVGVTGAASGIGRAIAGSCPSGGSEARVIGRDAGGVSPPVAGHSTRLLPFDISNSRLLPRDRSRGA